MLLRARLVLPAHLLSRAPCVVLGPAPDTPPQLLLSLEGSREAPVQL